jgi:2-O-methyltransferase
MHEVINKEYIAQLVGTPTPTVLDIGCNDGEATRMFLDLFDAPLVHSFEPDPRAQARFEKNTAGFPVNLHRMALGDFDGNTTFYQSSADGVVQPMKEWDYSGSIRRPKDHLRVHPWCKFEKTITVPVRRLDTWAAENLPRATVDFIWADVQGAEVDLIKGGLETLRRTRFFYTEYNNRELYEGQVNLETIMTMLPEFIIERRYTEDVLLRNLAL